MKKTIIIFLILLINTSFPQDFYRLELLFEKNTHDMMQAEFQLDSLNQALEYISNQLEADKRNPESKQKSRAEWYQKLQHVAESIEEQKNLIKEYHKILDSLKNELQKSYARTIDSLNNTLIKTSDEKSREEIQQQIYTLSEKRLMMLPTFKSFSFDPQKIVDIDLNNVHDSLEEAIYSDYLNNARVEIIQALENLKNMHKEIDELIYLRERSHLFLEDMNENRPLMIATQSISETPNVFNRTDLNGTSASLPQAETLINMLEQFRPEYYPDQKYSWTSPVDSGKVIMSLDEYKNILNRAEDILQSYLHFLDRKVQK